MMKSLEERKQEAADIHDSLVDRGGDLELLKALVIFTIELPPDMDHVIMPTLEAFLEVMRLLGPESTQLAN